MEMLNFDKISGCGRPALLETSPETVVLLSRYKKRQVSVRAIQPVEKNGPLKDSCSGDIRLAWRCAFHAPFENTRFTWVCALN